MRSAAPWITKVIAAVALATGSLAHAINYQTGHGRLSIDAEYDGVLHNVDNCPLVSNQDQSDIDIDGIGDACDSDMDGDGLSNEAEYGIGTDPTRTDTDGDGLTDGAEYNQYATNPTLMDTDGDGVNDGDEIALNSDPLDSSSVPSYADGDINLDGVLNAADLIVAHRAAMGEITLTALQLSHGDVAPRVNGVSSPDGQFNVGDIVVISRIVFQLN